MELLCWTPEAQHCKSTILQHEINIKIKLKTRTIIASSNSTSGYFSEGNKNINLKRYTHVYCSMIHKSQDMAMEAIEMSTTDGWMDKTDVE